jgi:hypothetical protein
MERKVSCTGLLGDVTCFVVRVALIRNAMIQGALLNTLFKCKYGAVHGTETELKRCNRVRQNLKQLKITDWQTHLLSQRLKSKHNE